jgi:hypothetical protein
MEKRLFAALLRQLSCPGGATLRGKFTFDSSQDLKPSSKILPIVAALARRFLREQQGRASVRWGSGDAKKGEAVMAHIDSTVLDSAESADANACFARGMIYSAGVGVTADLVEAHKWFNIAAMRGHGDAARLRREIAEQMSDAEIGSAQRAARAWLKAHPQEKTVAAVPVAA